MDNSNNHRDNGARGLSWVRKLGTLSLLYLAVFLTRIGFGTILILFPLYLDVPPGQDAVVGGILALYPLMEAGSAIPIGALVDRKGRRRAFLVGMALIAGLTFIMASTRNVAIVGGAHGLMGLSAALVTISSLTMITDLTVVENRGAGMGAFDLSNLAGYGVGVILGTVFHSIFPNNLGLAFIFVALIFSGATTVSFFLLEEPPHLRTERKSVKEMMAGNLGGDLNSILPMWFSLTIILGFYFFLPRLAKNANATLSHSAFLITLGLVVLGAGAVMFGRLSDKIGRWKTMLIGVFGQVGFLLIFPQLFDKLLEATASGSLAGAAATVGPIGILAGLFFFFGTALVPSMLAYIGDKAHREIRGSAMGLYSFMLSLGIAVGNVLAGLLTQFGGVYAVFYFGAAIFSGMSLTTALLLRRQNNLVRSRQELVDTSRSTQTPV